MAFQSSINIRPPLAVEGDFASTGVYHSMLAGVQQLVADTAGVYMARFAWANLVTGKTTNAKPVDVTNCALGFSRRGSNTAVITDWQGRASMLIPAGYGVTLYDRGDFWVKTTTAAQIGQFVMASDTDGTIATDADGTLAGYTDTGFKVASVGEANTLIKITNI